MTDQEYLEASWGWPVCIGCKNMAHKANREWGKLRNCPRIGGEGRWIWEPRDKQGEMVIPETCMFKEPA